MHPILRTLILLSPTLSLTAQSLVTAEIQHGNDAQATSVVEADNAGNIFAAVNFWDDLDADPGPATVNMNSAGSQDIAILKLNSAGDYIWGKQIGGTGFQSASDMAIDPSGNVYVFGYFNGTMDMDPGPGTFNIVSAGTDDIFVGKYSTSGNLLWAYSIGGTGTEQNYGFDLDADGDPVLHGYFQNTVDFNPGAGTYNLTAGVGGSTFILKLQEDGSFDFAFAMGAIYGNQLVVDASDNLFITGLFWGTIDFDPGVGVANLSATAFSSDAFVLKLSPTGAYNWAVKFSGSGSEQGTDLVVDVPNHTATITGFYDNTIDADPGIGTTNLVSAGGVDAFLIQLHAETGAYTWSKSFGGLGFQAGLSIAQTSGGKIHLAGTFEQTTDFDGGPAVANLTSAGNSDIFKAQYETNGNYASAEKIGGTLGDGAQDIQLDADGAILLCGFFDGLVDFDPGPVTFNLNSGFTGWDGFIAKYCTVYNITNNVSICAGESYFAGGAWQTTSGVYMDYYTPAEGCDSIVTTNLTVNNPVVNLGADFTLCAGTTSTLNAGNPGATYIWSTGATTQTITVNTTGTYAVTITDNAGCTASDAVTVTVVAAPNANLGTDVAICAGETVLLDAGNPGCTYLWNTGATTQTITVTTAGTYTVLVTNPAGCTDNDAIIVTVSPLPSVDLGADVSICAGTTTVLDAGNPGATYLWNTGATTQTITVGISGTYSVEVTQPGGCSANDAIIISVAPNPDVDLGPNQTICAGELVTLDAENTGATYLWNTGETTQTIVVTAEGNYSVTVTNMFGCTDDDLTHINVAPSPLAELPETISTCADSPVVLDAENDGSTFVWNTGETTQSISVTTSGLYTVEIENGFGCTLLDSVLVSLYLNPEVTLGADTGFCAGGEIILDATTPDVTYAWSTGATTSTITATTSGLYSVTITNLFGCTSSDSIFVSVYTVPVVDLGPDGAYCADDTVILDVTIPDGTYLWNTGDMTASIVITESGTFSVLVTDANGCSTDDTISITIHPLPVVDLGPDITTCENAAVVLDATTPFCTYLWSTGETTATISTSTAGMYWVQVTNSFGCHLIDSIQVFTLPAAEAFLELPPYVLCQWDEAFALTGGSPAGGYYIGPGVTDGLFDPQATLDGIFDIGYVIESANGCHDTAWGVIQVDYCHPIINFEKNALQLYPNPAMYSCTVVLPAELQTGDIYISNAIGQIVLHQNIKGNETILPLADLPAGSYSVMFLTTSYRATQQLIIVRE